MPADDFSVATGDDPHDSDANSLTMMAEVPLVAGLRHKRAEHRVFDKRGLSGIDNKLVPVKIAIQRVT